MIKVSDEILLGKNTYDYLDKKTDKVYVGSLYRKMYFYGASIRFEFVVEVGGVKKYKKEKVISLANLKSEADFKERVEKANTIVSRIYHDYEDGLLDEEQLAKRLPDSNFAKSLLGGRSYELNFYELSINYYKQLKDRYENRKTNTVTKSTLNRAKTFRNSKMFGSLLPGIQNSTLKRIPLNQISTQEMSKELFEDFVEYLLNDAPNGLEKGYSLSYVKNIVDYIKQVFKYAVRDNYLSENIVKDIATPKKPNVGRVKTTDYFTEDEQDLVYSSCHKLGKPYLAAMFKFGYSMGLRKEELLALAYEDINFDKNIVTINRAYTSGAFGDTKTELSLRTIPITDLGLEALDEIMQITYDLPARVYEVKRSREFKGFVDESLKLVFLNFSKKKGQREEPRNWTDKAIAIAWKAVREESGVDKPLNLVRHTYASALFNAGISARRIARNLGHSNETMVFTRYAELSDDFDDDYMTAVNAAFVRK